MTQQEDHDRLIRLETTVDGLGPTLDRIEAAVTDQRSEGDKAHADLWKGVRKAQDSAKTASIWSRVGTTLWGLTIAAALAIVGIREKPL